MTITQSFLHNHLRSNTVASNKATDNSVSPHEAADTSPMMTMDICNGKDQSGIPIPNQYLAPVKWTHSTNSTLHLRGGGEPKRSGRPSTDGTAPRAPSVNSQRQADSNSCGILQGLKDKRDERREIRKAEKQQKERNKKEKEEKKLKDRLHAEWLKTADGQLYLAGG